VASGHVSSFSDPLVVCKECRQRFRADQLEGDRCPNCGGELMDRPTRARRHHAKFPPGTERKFSS
jgi:glycyl-tRNA synthetase (class II)